MSNLRPPVRILHQGGAGRAAFVVALPKTSESLSCRADCPPVRRNRPPAPAAGQAFADLLAPAFKDFQSDRAKLAAREIRMRRQVLVIWTAVTLLSVIDLLLCHRLGLQFHDWSRLALAAGVTAGIALFYQISGRSTHLARAAHLDPAMDCRRRGRAACDCSDRGSAPSTCSRARKDGLSSSR